MRLSDDLIKKNAEAIARLSFGLKPAKRVYTTGSPKKEYTCRCSSCKLEVNIRAFILPVGWFAVTKKVSGDIMDGKLESHRFCSIECLRNFYEESR
jgi:hypothetical protein